MKLIIFIRAARLKFSEMAPKKSYTRERLDGIAADSAVKMKGFMPNGKLTCEYLHQGAETTVRGADDLSFHWEIEASGYNDQCKVEAKCSNVATRGVPFPERWRTALNCLEINKMVGESTKDVTEFGTSNVKCELLGQAKK